MSKPDLKFYLIIDQPLSLNKDNISGKFNFFASLQSAFKTKLQRKVDLKTTLWKLAHFDDEGKFGKRFLLFTNLKEATKYSEANQSNGMATPIFRATVDESIIDSIEKKQSSDSTHYISNVCNATYKTNKFGNNSSGINLISATVAMRSSHRARFINFVFAQGDSKQRHNHRRFQRGVMQTEKNGISAESAAHGILKVLNHYIKKPSMKKHHVNEAKKLRAVVLETLGNSSTSSDEKLQIVLQEFTRAQSMKNLLITGSSPKVNSKGSFVNLLNFSVEALEFHSGWSEKGLKKTGQAFEEKMSLQEDSTLQIGR